MHAAETRARGDARATRRIVRALLALGLVVAGKPALAGADPPFAAASPRAAALWREARSFEGQGKHAAAASLFAEVAALAPGAQEPLWRAARAHYRAAQALVETASAEREAELTRTFELASRAIELDPRCAECHLYAFIGLSMLSREKGSLSALRNARRMKQLIDRALELGPTHSDGPRNHELANAYYAAGIFYRVVPDSALASITIGARRDIERTIAYLRKALAITEDRIDYQVSLGSALLCLGAQRRDAALAAEGRSHLRRAGEIELFLDEDELNRAWAQVLLDEPEWACKGRTAWKRLTGR